MQCIHQNYLRECVFNFSWTGAWVKCDDVRPCPTGSGPEVQEPGQKGEPMTLQDSKAMIKRLWDAITLKNDFNLNSWEIEFVASIRDREPAILSQKQRAIIYGIYSRVKEKK